MFRLRWLLLVFLFSCSARCAYAGEEAETGAQEPAPESGTITVEVRYKDTGEPVEGVFVQLDPSLPGISSGVSSKEGSCVFDDIVWGSHQVSIENPFLLFGSQEGKPSSFLYSASEVGKALTLSQESPKAAIRFEVERGRTLSGTVTRHDGTPLAGAVVALFQGTDQANYVFAVTDEKGRFEMNGVGSDRSARLGIYSVFGGLRSEDPLFGALPLWGEGVALTEESLYAEFKVPTVALDFTFELAAPVRLFKTRMDGLLPDIGIWVGGESEKPEGAPTAIIVLINVESERTGLLPGARYRVHVEDFPANTALTFGVEKPSVTSSGQTYGCFRTMRTGKGKQAVTVRMYARGARLSRAVVVGVPALLVMVVCVVVLVQGARRRRRRPA